MRSRSYIYVSFADISENSLLSTLVSWKRSEAIFIIQLDEDSMFLLIYIR